MKNLFAYACVPLAGRYPRQLDNDIFSTRIDKCTGIVTIILTSACIIKRLPAFHIEPVVSPPPQGQGTPCWRGYA